MKKKILCIVLSISMLAVFMPSMAFATYVEGAAIPVDNEIQFFAALEDSSTGTPENPYKIAVNEDITFTSASQLVFEVTEGRGIEIDLNGHKLNANGHQLFAVTGNSLLTIEDGNIVNGYSELAGGAIYVSEGSTLTLKDITIKDCFAEIQGGAVDVFGTLNLTGKVVIDENTAQGETLSTIDSNVSVNNAGYISAKNLSAKSHIGVTALHNFGEAGYNDIKYFFADEFLTGEPSFENTELGIAYDIFSNNRYIMAVQPAYFAAVHNAKVELIDKYHPDEETTKIEKLILAYNTRVMDEIETCGTVEKVAELVAKAKAQDAIIAAGGTGATVAALAAYNYVDKAFVVPYQESLKKLNDYAKDGNLIAQETINNLDSSLKDSVLKGFGVTPTTGEVVVTVIAKVAKEIVAYNTDMVAMNTALQQIQGQEAVKFTFQAIGRVVYSVREGVYEFFRTIFNKPAKA